MANSNRYHSFAEERDGSRAKWFIDGEDYMSAVADAIESAREEIMITGWQMSPTHFHEKT